MRQFNTFIHVFKNSLLPSKKYYSRLLKTRLQFSLKYFLALIFCLQILSLLIILVNNRFFLNDYRELKVNINSITNDFPRDLTITVKNGVLTTSYDRPVFIWYRHNGVPEPLAVIDPEANPSKIYDYNSQFLITGNGIFSRSQDNQEYRFTKDDNFVINKQTVSDFKKTTDKIYSQLPIFLALIVIFLLIIMPTLSALFLLLSLVFTSTAVFLGTKLIHKNIAFIKVFHIALHSSTIPLMMDYLFFALGLPITLPFGFTIIYIMFLTLSLYEVYAVK